jgi:acyl-CoA reductase-like NAD-dependent aldehyde dehydrogenase
VLKSSPGAPGAAYILAEACEKVGFPPGVVNVVTADRDVSEYLVRHPDVDKVAFTGSTVAGRRIASICGERIARYTLELGGKSAAVVLEDYDVDKLAQTLTGGTTFLTGQVCFSLTRIIVPRARHDEFVDALSAQFNKVVVGDPFDANVHMGPLATERQRVRVENYIARGKADGATLAAGGGRPTHLKRGFYIEPTVFANVDNSSVIAQEEIFGPVLSVIPADDERQAVEIANDSIYGLNAAVFTNDPERAYRVARGFKSGVVMQNGLDMGAMEMGVGGFKQSGIGREGGVAGLRPYLEAKSIVMDSLPPGL